MSYSGPTDPASSRSGADLASLAEDLFPPSPPAPPSTAGAPFKIKFTAKNYLDHDSEASSFSFRDDSRDAPGSDYESERADQRDGTLLDPTMTTTRRGSARLDPNGSAGADSAASYASHGGGANGDEAEYGSASGRPTRSHASRTAPRAIIDSEDDGEDGDFENDVAMDDDQDAMQPAGPSSSRRKARVKVPDDEDEEADFQPQRVAAVTLHGRKTSRPAVYAEPSDEEDEEVKAPRTMRLRRGTSRRQDDFIENDGYDDEQDIEYGRPKRSSRNEEKKAREAAAMKQAAKERRQQGQTSRFDSRPKPRSTRNSQKADVSYEDDGAGVTSTGTDSEEELDLHDDDSDFGEAAPERTLRKKAKVDYYSIPALEAPPERASNKKGKGKQRSDNPFSGLPQNLTGAQWAALYPERNGQPDSSDDDTPNISKAPLFSSSAAAGASGDGGLFAGGASMELPSGNPNNLGRVGKATLADVDPLGVASNISFDSVGGLGNHIQQLKEMVSLPLLYPEVFERFNITPPRGVLFHGPPGTGKTLLARALAASCSTEGRKISFFMRKGADVLSKWVGEAERQLRLLFEEAKNCQPSIIFFDEIDGLAPVRSSKQEQIHASIVSTLLALMDGMDGRGQVIVIGATNRPDAIDPALRRPGRFDREFYFPLPNLDGRRKIIDIHTSGWNPPLDDPFKDELATLTKGYGGADLRALCTEAALNAVQRTYPQIYKTNERLVIKPETIEVTARDFIISQKNLIPSTARATSSSAAAIPPQLEPLLNEALERAKAALAKVLPEVKKANILEEAEWEEEGGGFQREKMMQAFETLRVFRPRMLICGDSGMGQNYVGAAVLQHLEGFHVQNLDLATLVSDSSRTMEAACVQLFVEAKRHKPAILFVPSLITWCASVTDTVKATIKGLLDGLDPSDPILLLAIVDGPLHDIPGDVRSWFGFVKGNRVVMAQPKPDQLRSFFSDVIAGVRRPPTEFPDAMPRKKRVLEKLDIAPPLPPREPTAAELQAQEHSDLRTLEYLKWRLGPVLNELKKRYKRFTRSFYTDWRGDDFNIREQQLRDGEPVVGLGVQPYHNVDLDSMHLDLYDGTYHTPDDFLQDILRIQFNAQINVELENDAEAPIKAGQMVNHVNVMLDQTFDQQFKSDCARMAERMKTRTPPKGKESKGKGKALLQEPSAIAAAVAAGGGSGRYTTRSRHPGNAEEGLELEDIGEVERRLKRSRREGDELEDGLSEQGPLKRTKGLNGTLIEDVGGVEEGEPFSIEHDSGHQPIASTSRLEPPSSLASLLNPPTGPLIAPISSTSAALPLPQPPLFSEPLSSSFGRDAAVGLGGDVIGAADDPSFPADIGDIVPVGSVAMASGPAHTSNNSLNGNVRIGEGSSVPSPQLDVAPQGMFVEEDSAVAPAPHREATPIVVDPPTPEPLPDFELSEVTVDGFETFLSEQTTLLTIDQLEQLRAALYDIVWRERKSWNRGEMLALLQELAVAFVEEVADARE